jgi:hypothetical protein
MMAAAAPAGAAAKEEQTSFDVILKGADAAKKIGVIKVVRERPAWAWPRPRRSSTPRARPSSRA